MSVRSYTSAPATVAGGRPRGGSGSAAAGGSSNFGVVRVDGVELETLLRQLPVSIGAMPPGLAPIKIATAVTRHGLDPSIAALPPSELREMLRQTGIHAYGTVTVFRKPVESLITPDATHLWFAPASETEPGPPTDCVALWMNKGAVAGSPEILLVDSVVWGLQCSRVPPLQSKVVRHSKLDLLGVPLVPMTSISYPSHLADLDEYLYRQDIEWLRTTILFQRPPTSVPRSLWRTGAEVRYQQLTRTELLEKLRHAYCLWHCAVDIGVYSFDLYAMLSEVYSMLRARL